jgi:hypothetical protein
VAYEMLRESDRSIEPIVNVGIEVRGARDHDRASEQPEKPASDPLQCARLLRLGIAPADSLAKWFKTGHREPNPVVHGIWRNSRPRQGKEISFVSVERGDSCYRTAGKRVFLG